MNEEFNNLPKEERPYERCIRHGAEGLSRRERAHCPGACRGSVKAHSGAGRVYGT